MSWLRILAGLASVTPLWVAVPAALILSAGVFGLESGLPLGYLLFAYVVWVLSNYFFEVLEHKATGGGDWPVLSIETLVGRRRQMGLVFGLMIAIGIGVVVLSRSYLGFTATLALVGAAILLLPASLAMLALTRNPLRASNPRLLANAAIRMRSGYSVALIACILVALIWFVAISGQSFVAFLAGCYACLALAHLIGSIVYRYRLALGVHAPRSPEVKAAREQDRLHRKRAATLDYAYGLTSRGNSRGSLSYIEAYLETEVDPIEARLWMLDRMTRWEDPGPALTFGRDLQTRLADERPSEAHKLGLRCALLEEAIKERV